MHTCLVCRIPSGTGGCADGSLTHRVSDRRGDWIRSIVPWNGCIPTVPPLFADPLTTAQVRSAVSGSRPPCSSIRSARNCENVSMALVPMKYATLRASLFFWTSYGCADTAWRFQLINRIRHSATLVATLPPETQRAARDSYAIALRAVFTMAAVSTAVAFVVRLPVSRSSIPSPFVMVSTPTMRALFLAPREIPRSPASQRIRRRRVPCSGATRANVDDTR